MHFTVYQTTNLVNGKIYVGIHTTENPDDDYLGSGDRLTVAIKKYGRAAFKKEVLFDFDNAEDMAAKEREIVTREFVRRADTYNLVPGGYQGNRWFYAQRAALALRSPEALAEAGRKGKARQRELAQLDPSYEDRRNAARARLMRRLHQEGRAPRPPDWKGKRLPDDIKVKVSEAKRGTGLGASNSQHGTRWVHRAGEAPRKVPSTDLDSWLARGWLPGRGQIKNTTRV